MKQVAHSWKDPLQVAYNISISEHSKTWAFLYSGRRDDLGNGRCSYIALIPDEKVQGKSFDVLENKLSSDQGKFDNFWLGYFSYDLKNDLEKLPEDQESHIAAPKLWWVKYKLILEFDHELEALNVHYKSEEEREWLLSKLDSLKELPNELEKPTVSNLDSNMSREGYLGNVKAILEAIENGVVYEANLTRKYVGSILHNQEFKLFIQLAQLSPGQYSAYLKFEDYHIISSSPEKFLTQDSNGNVIAQPIKGTIKIESEDGLNEKEELANSEKDKAENLMIVDLMRNDLSRTCEVGSVKVPDLFHITSYPHLHHLSSSVIGKKRGDIGSLELIKNCFPPSSMTGAPKIKVMEVCSGLECKARGIYSGSIGYLGGDGSFDLSVVIRTIVIHEDQFEFQVGGAIVIDSTPEGELEETYTKASALCKVLGIEVSELDENKSNVFAL